MSLYNGEADFSELSLDDGENVQLTYQENAITLDLPDIQTLSERKRREIIEGLNKLLQEDENQSPQNMSFSDRISFILDKNKGNFLLPARVDVITRTGKVVVSKSSYQVDGDISSIVTDAMPKKNRDFLYDVHLIAIQLFMKKWRRNLWGLVEKIKIILGWLNQLQAYASIIGFILFLAGLLTGQTSVMITSFLPIIIAGTLSLVKKRL